MTIIHRRKFLQIGSLASASFMVPKFLKAFEKQILEKNKVLVIIQLSGGNDGLNTVIPYENDLYYKARQVIGIPKTKVHRMDDVQGLHPALTSLKGLYDNGELTLLNGVGYPNPDRSHFRSMDIWQSASESQEMISTGWVGRYLDAKCNGKGRPSLALEMDDTLSLALKGQEQSGIAVNNPGQLYGTSNDAYFKAVLNKHVKSNAQPDTHAAADYLYKTMAETLSSADYIYKHSKIYKTKLTYPNTGIGKDLKTIAELIQSGIDTQVYYLSLGSFDTHVNQQGQQANLLKQLDAAVDVFVKDLKANDRFKDTLLMTFSEFGRRVAQNASDGTDHGTANCMFMVSGGLKKQGIFNAAPDLQNLDAGDLKLQIDFKDVYGTILDHWLKMDATKILHRKSQYLNFI